jgi:hypothetical protein
MPTLDLQDVDEDAVMQSVVLVVDDLGRVDEQWRAADMDILELRDVEDFLTQDEIRVDTSCMNCASV